MPHVSGGGRAACALLITTLAAGGLSSTAAAAPAVGELVSRADFAEGAPYANAELQAASADGQYVAFEADVDGEGGTKVPTLLLRNRTADVTMYLLINDLGNPYSSDSYTASGGTYRVVDISDDGNLVLIVRKNYGAANPEQLLLRDVAAATTTAIGDDPTGAPLRTVASTARFINGGPGVLYSGRDAATFHPSIYRRATPGAAPTVVSAERELTDATRDGTVITWTRSLRTAFRPGGSTPVSQRWPERDGEAVGYTIAGQAPKVAGRTTWVERTAAPAPYCKEAGVTAVRTTYSPVTVDDYGHTLKVSSSVFDERYPSSDHRPQTRVYDVSEDGRRTIGSIEYWNGPPGRSFWIDPANGTDGLPLLPELPSLSPYDTGSADGALFYAHDTGILRQENRYDDPSKSGIYAYDPVTEGTTPAVQTPAELPGAIPDEPTLTADVTWAKCEPDPVPTKLGSFGQYVDLKLAKPVTTSKPAGTVKVTLNPSPSLRAVSKVSVKVQTLGFTTWSRTVTSDQTVSLPRPYWLLPQTVVVSFGVPADPASGAAADSRQENPGWQALR